MRELEPVNGIILLEHWVNLFGFPIEDMIESVVGWTNVCTFWILPYDSLCKYSEGDALKIWETSFSVNEPVVVISTCMLLVAIKFKEIRVASRDRVKKQLFLATN